VEALIASTKEGNMKRSITKELFAALLTLMAETTAFDAPPGRDRNGLQRARRQAEKAIERALEEA
jgi:hypothetical protein